MGKILTVVVPTYNAEKYLRDNLESFKIPELMEDLEILIVNDGSTDHSLEIAEEYVRQYPDTYRVITKKTADMAPGSTAGLQMRGEHISKWLMPMTGSAKKPFVIWSGP
ncbi:MAG: glycosyltransferase family A protein [Lachnospiraceae bacterium]